MNYWNGKHGNRQTGTLAMVRTGNPGKTVVALAKVIIRIGALAWFGFACLYTYYAVSRPTLKQLDSGRLYPLENHGRVAYLTLQEINNLHYVRDAALGLILVAVIMGLIVKIRERRNPQEQSDQ
jgi:hypothetical protein